ncbi:MAG TPA: glutamate--tRNA ligase [Alphaproteobacteria bacterium]|nr:glutamate--tRNA ligase [Alphaproteobacteria bacterium]
MPVIVRFAPSPTGFLHIGGARTALFNWLYARHTKGRFLLRIEDTDKARSTEAAKAAILDGLSWLGLDWDGDVVYQSARAERHAQVARDLLAAGRAYRCVCTAEELAARREAARAAGRPTGYDRKCRDRDPASIASGMPYAIRLKAPVEGETAIDDLVQGTVRVSHEQLDDMILLRADGTPVYMLSVVVDDHDMNVTHVIRGDDHLTNAFRQTQLYRALDWSVPHFAHIPLIHGPDGAKLSKRHGALGVDAYRDLGYLPEAMRNYLLRLGWAHGDDEIISTEQAIEWFDIGQVGRSPARFDFAKLDNLNGHYLRAAENGRLLELLRPIFKKELGLEPDPAAETRLLRGMDGLKARAKTLVELARLGSAYVRPRPIALDPKAAALLDPAARARLAHLVPALEALASWDQGSIEAAVRASAEAEGVKLGELAQPLRAALTGSTVSPGIFEVMELLGNAEVLGRIRDVT